MTADIGIPAFQEINELHTVAENCQLTGVSDFHVYRNENADKTGRLTMPLHRCNFFQISLDQKSDYTLFINDTKTCTTEYTIYFVGRGKLISWDSGPAKKWKGYNVIFKADFLNIGCERSAFLKDFNFLRTDNNPTLPVSPSDYAILADICEKMLYVQSNGPIDSVILQHYLHIFLYSIKKVYERQKETFPSNSSRDIDIVNEFEYLVDEHYMDFKKVNQYAEKLFISSKYLSQIIRNIYGKSAKQVIMERILVEARALLCQTTLTVNQIAFRLNFEDVSHFVKFFRNLAGASPSEYRKKSSLYRSI